MSTTESRRWWASIGRGSPLEMGFVEVDRAASTQDWQSLGPEAVIARRTEYQKVVESVAEGFDAIEPLGWQGDGTLIVVSAHGDPRAWSADPIVNAAMRAGILALTLHEQLVKAGFAARIAAHAGRVSFDADTGRMASPDIDRVGHLVEHECPVGAVALSEDVYLNLPSSLRERCDYLGTTLRDRTVTYVSPRAAVARRDASRFVPPGEDLEPETQRLLRYVQHADVSRLRYVGFRLQRPQPPSLDLLEVFTPLPVEEHRPEPLLSEASGGADKDLTIAGQSGKATPLPPWQTAERSSVRARTFTEVFRQRRHLVVLGAPGAGKSTLLRWLAVVSARGRVACRERLGVDERLLPVLLPVGRLFELREARVRDGGAAGVPTVLDVAATHFRQLQVGDAETRLGILLRKRLEAGACLVLFDGLDEVPIGRRMDVVRWIENFASAYHENRFVVTSRLLGFTGVDLPGGGTVVLRPLDDEQIRSYLRAWHRAYRAWEGNLSREAIELDQRPAETEALQVADTIFRDERLHSLAAHPFLLSAIALVHRAEGRLPAHRIQLYDIFARALCETWETARRSATGHSVPIDYEAEAIPVLGHLAFWLHENYATGAAPEDQVRQEIARALVEHSGIADQEATESARGFLRRAADELQLIIPRGPGLYGFAHLTFQEFFAAAYLHVKERFEREAKRRWYDPRWEEVLLLGIGMMALLQKRPERAGRLIETFLRWVVPGHPYMTRILKKHVMLATKACANAPNLATVHLEKVGKRFIADARATRFTVVWSEVLAALDCVRGTRFGEWLGDQMISKSTSAGFADRWMAVMFLNRLRHARALPMLATLAESSKEDRLRAAAARALGALDTEDTLAVLRGLARSDRSGSVRRAAARALARRGDPADLNLVIALLKNDSDKSIRLACAMGLGERGDERAFTALLEALSSDRSREVRREAGQALDAVGGRVRSVQALRALLDAPEGDTRATVLATLAQIDPPSAVDDVLAAVAHDLDPEVRSVAARALGAIGCERCVDMLVKCFRDERAEEVRATIAEALGAAGHARAIEPLRVALCGESSEEVRDASIEALGRLRSRTALADLVAVLEREQEPRHVRVTAAVALGDLGDSRAATTLIRVLESDRDAWVRENAATVLGRMRPEDAFDALVTALTNDGKEGVRAAAARALAQLDDKRAIPYLVEALEVGGLLLRNAAAEALWALSDRITL